MVTVNDNAEDTLIKVENAVCESFGIGIEKIREKNLTNAAVIARSMLFYTLHHDYSFSVNKLARIYGRTPRSVNYVISKIKYCIEKQKAYNVMYARVVSKINNIV